MNYVRSMLTLLAAMLAWGATAQPPKLVHYQGRLTSTGGTPITLSQTLFFSLWSGGADGTANSGTQVYRERATVTPDSQGVFEHQVGTGTVELGTLDGTLFNTDQSIHLQVAVGTVGNVLLPRTRVTTVGYAFVAQFAEQAGTPVVTAVTDQTGGLLVIGDLLQVDGANLANAAVLIGDRPAPIKTRNATQLVVQVPAGTPMGLNSVAVVQDEGGGDSRVVAHVDVHRLIVGVSASGSGTDFIYVIDANTRAIVNQFDPSTDIGNGVTGGQIAFAHNGALAIIPTMSSGQLIVVSLTANPPAVVQTLNDGSISQAQAVSASPDGKLIVTSSAGNNRLRVDLFDEFFPPYATPLTTANAFNLTALPGTFTPRGSAFLGDGLFIACGLAAGQVIGYARDLGTTVFTDEPTLASVIPSPFGLRMTPDGTRAVITGGGANNVASFYSEADGLSLAPSGGAAAGGGTAAVRVAINPEGTMLFVADSASDEIRMLALDGNNVIFVGQHEGDTGDSISYQVVDVEPVDGKLLIAGTNNRSYRLFERVGGSIAPLGDFVTLSGSSNSVAIDVRFQP